MKIEWFNRMAFEQCVYALARFFPLGAHTTIQFLLLKINNQAVEIENIKYILEQEIMKPQRKILHKECNRNELVARI